EGRDRLGQLIVGGRVTMRERGGPPLPHDGTQAAVVGLPRVFIDRGDVCEQSKEECLFDGAPPAVEGSHNQQAQADLDPGEADGCSARTFSIRRANASCSVDSPAGSCRSSSVSVAIVAASRSFSLSSTASTAALPFNPQVSCDSIQGSDGLANFNRGR